MNMIKHIGTVGNGSEMRSVRVDPRVSYHAIAQSRVSADKAEIAIRYDLESCVEAAKNFVSNVRKISNVKDIEVKIICKPIFREHA
jgi:ACT domain-containing protein